MNNKQFGAEYCWYMASHLFIFDPEKEYGVPHALHIHLQNIFYLLIFLQMLSLHHEVKLDPIFFKYTIHRKNPKEMKDV